MKCEKEALVNEARKKKQGLKEWKGFLPVAVHKGSEHHSMLNSTKKKKKILQ